MIVRLISLFSLIIARYFCTGSVAQRQESERKQRVKQLQKWFGQLRSKSNDVSLAMVEKWPVNK